MRMYALTAMTAPPRRLRPDTTPSARGGLAGGEAVLEAGELGPEGLGHAVAEAVVEVLDVGDLLAPPLHVDLEQLRLLLGVEAKTLGVEGALGRQPADRGRHGLGGTGHPLE